MVLFERLTSACSSANSILAQQTTINPSCLRALLQGANRALRERLADALEELDVAHGQLHILQGLQQQLEEATPGAADLAAAALEQERVLQAARDARVLQLLRAKASWDGAAGWKAGTAVSG